MRATLAAWLVLAGYVAVAIPQPTSQRPSRIERGSIGRRLQLNRSPPLA